MGTGHSVVPTKQEQIKEDRWRVLRQECASIADTDERRRRQVKLIFMGIGDLVDQMLRDLRERAARPFRQWLTLDDRDHQIR